MGQWLLYFLLFSLLSGFVFTVKKNSGKSRVVRPRIPLDESNLPTRTLAEWQRMPKQSLELICNRLNIVSTGGRNILADRLFQHYQSFPERVLPEGPPVITNTNNSTTPVITNTNNSTIPPSSTTTSSNLEQPDISFLINEAVTRLLPTILAARESSTSQTRPATGSSANGPLITTTTRSPPVQNGTTEQRELLGFPGLPALHHLTASSGI